MDTDSVRKPWRDVAKTGLKFYSVGAVGIAVQLTCLVVLAGHLHFNYLIATALAVEMAILHNFVWHESWTWRAHTKRNPAGMFGRLARFNLSNGTLSIIGNVLLMRLFVGVAHLHFLISNVLSIGSCSLLNFLISHRYIFTSSRTRNTRNELV